ncbi:MAG: ABC transporter ATP-binding protein [Oscillospiraceae bacterium]|nr:ABC transporter ATP-binding protein [Oscillospiraceae bacterium]
MTRLFAYLRGYEWRVALTLSIKTIGTFMDLLIPWALSHIIDDVIPKNNISQVYLWGLVMLAFCLVAWFGNIISNRMAASVSRDATKKIRYNLFSKISYLSSRDVDRFTIPSLISRMTSDTYSVHHALGMMQRMGVRAPILLFGGIIITMLADPVLTSVLLTLIPIVSFMTVYVSKKGAGLFKIVQNAVDALVRAVRENASGIRVIKALSKSEYEKKRFVEVNTDLTQKERRAETVMAFINPAMSVMLNLGLCAVIGIGAYRVNSGKTEIGDIIAFMTYFTIILNSIMMITRIFMNLSKASASASRIDEVLSCPDELSIGCSVEEDASAPAVEFKNVSFSYENSGFKLSDISFAVKQGETLGILGPTGSGKTSLISLLLRFYHINDGEIRINGVNINDFTLSDLRRKFGTVLQNDTLFRDSIGENISFGRKITEEEMLSAAQAAQADKFISDAGGFDAEVAIKGANFSGGQKQRLLITRALAGNPEIFIFDDSFSALDYKTDSLLREKLRDSFGDKTKIIVTQRVSSVLSAEHILVLDNGKCAGYGTHEELMKTCAIYRETAELQLGGESYAQ